MGQRLMTMLTKQARLKFYANLTIQLIPSSLAEDEKAAFSSEYVTGLPWGTSQTEADVGYNICVL